VANRAAAVVVNVVAHRVILVFTAAVAVATVAVVAVYAAVAAVAAVALRAVQWWLIGLLQLWLM
jgi:hypothetical protein